MARVFKIFKEEFEVWLKFYEEKVKGHDKNCSIRRERYLPTCDCGKALKGEI